MDFISIATILSAIAGLLSVIIPVIQILLSRSRKELTYKVLSNTSLVHTSAQDAVKIFLKDGSAINNADLLVFRVENTGNADITSTDYANQQPIKFFFSDREIINVTEVRTEPDPGLFSQDGVISSQRGEKPGNIILGCPELNKKTSVILSILMNKSGKHQEKVDISSSGGLRGGKIKQYKTPKRFSRRSAIVGAGMALLLLSSIIALWRPSFSNSNCSSGTIAIGGSTALLPLVTKAAQKYEAMCPQANISINQNVASSEAGLSSVASGKIQIGNSDLRSSDLGLVDHPVAVTTYVLVLNQDVSGVTNLTSLQIQGIYSGSIKNWHEVGGPNLPIFVVSRTSTSGTRKTFEQYILNGPEKLSLDPSSHTEVDTTDIMANTVANTPGAIGYVDVGTATRDKLQTVLIDDVEALPGNIQNGRYTFWTVEHMYTKGNPSDLATAFLQYIVGDEIKGTISDLYYVPFNDVSSNTINNHPSPPTPGL